MEGPSERRGRLHFLFGDTRNFNPDLCEPGTCGVESIESRPPLLPTQNNVQRWYDEATFHRWHLEYGDGAESMASAALDFDPEGCIPLAVETELRARTFAHPTFPASVGAAIQLQAPPVAVNPHDRAAVVMGNHILVVTDDRRVFVHGVYGNTVDYSYQLAGSLRPALAGERILVLQNRLLVIEADGRVFARNVDFSTNTIGGEVQLEGPPVAAAIARDKWVVTHDNQIVVITTEGQVWSHTIIEDVIRPAQFMPNPSGPPVAANPQDKHVLVVNRLLVVTDTGDVFSHALAPTSVGAFQPLPGARVGTSPQDKWVLAVDSRIFVLAREDTFRPTRLEGRRLGRQEGAFTESSDVSGDVCVFHTTHVAASVQGLNGCAHDEPDRARRQGGVGSIRRRPRPLRANDVLLVKQVPLPCTCRRPWLTNSGLACRPEQPGRSVRVRYWPREPGGGTGRQMEQQLSVPCGPFAVRRCRQNRDGIFSSYQRELG